MNRRALVSVLCAQLLLVSLAACGEAGGDADADSDADTDSDSDSDADPLYFAAEGTIYTRDGHALYLRGVNLSGQAKGAADHLYTVDQAEIDALLDGGMNSVRMLTFWKAIMPDGPEAIDEDYLDAFAERVQLLTQAGLYVIVDMHQDLWGVPFAAHGAPDWACPDEIKQGYEPGSPWWVNYTKPQVMGCFDNFYDSAELRGAFARAWGALAAAVCDHERVLGWDPLNEPHPGTRLADPQVDNEVLLPLYLEVLAEVEAACPGRLFFLEPSASFTMGLAEPIVVPAAHRERVVLAPHFYPPEVHEPSDTEGYEPDLEALRTEVTDLFQAYLDAGIPVWVGEFGGITTNPNFDLYLQDLHTVFLEQRISSALWDWYRGDGGFAFLDAEGQPKDVFDAVYRTPVPTRLPGKPSSIDADWGAGTTGLEVVCMDGRRVELLVPTSEGSCNATPAGALEPLAADRGWRAFRCTGDGPISLQCSAGP